MFTVETKSLDFDGSMFIFNCNATFLGQKLHAARELMIALNELLHDFTFTYHLSLAYSREISKTPKCSISDYRFLWSLLLQQDIKQN